MSEYQHITVLLHEAVEALNIKPNGVYIDGTFGRGGHSRLILSLLGDEGKLIVFDKDPQAIATAEELATADARVTVVHEGFSKLGEVLKRLEVAGIDGALFDLGISSPQVDDGSRGFSFRFDAPLDMRMDTTRGNTAADWLNSADETEIASIIRDYSEEKFARRIASTVVEKRQEQNITTTKQLADLVSSVVRSREKGQHPATRTFQAIRIHINGELEEIKSVLPQVGRLLNEGGRLAVISFHSLEDRIVKQFMRHYSQPKQLPKWVMLKEEDMDKPALKVMGKAIKPKEHEIKSNPRARSAVLRVVERTNGQWIDE